MRIRAFAGLSKHRLPARVEGIASAIGVALLHLASLLLSDTLEKISLCLDKEVPPILDGRLVADIPVSAVNIATEGAAKVLLARGIPVLYACRITAELLPFAESWPDMAII